MAQVGKPGGGVSGKPGGGMGGLGGGTPMTAEQADAANGTRRQNLYTTVGGLSRPGGGQRPSGPAGPPSPRQRPALNPKVLDPLINGQPAAYGASVVPDPVTGLPAYMHRPLPDPRLPPGAAPPPMGIGQAEGFALPATAGLGNNAPLDVGKMSVSERRARYKKLNPDWPYTRADEGVNSGTKF